MHRGTCPKMDRDAEREREEETDRHLKTERQKDGETDAKNILRAKKKRDEGSPYTN
jgi:hypothetical protein